MGQLFLQLLDRFQGVDTAFREIEAVVYDLAKAAQRVLQAKRVAIYLLLSKQTEPSPRTTVYCGDSEAAAALLRPVADLQHDRDGLVLGDLRPHTVRIDRDGRLQVRVRTEWAIAWLWVQGELAAESAHDDLLALLGVLASSYRNHLPSQERRSFYDQLLAIGGVRYEAVVTGICTIWREVLGADWACLWTYNKSAKFYEVTAQDDGEGHAEGFAEPRTPQQDESGIGHYADEEQQPVYADDISGWSRIGRHGTTFRVLLARSLEERGVHGALYVPLLVPKPAAGGRCDLLALYYRDQPRRVQPDGALLLMGRWTAHVLAHEEAAKRLRIQTDLASLTQRYLTKPTSDPQGLRAEYLGDLLRLISRTLNASGITLFMRSRFADVLQCIASTGLLEGGKVVPPNAYPLIHYRPNEGLTGRCYAENRTIIAPTNETVGHGPGKYDEIRQNAYANDAAIDPLLMQPIPMFAAEPAKGAIGVIRATEHTSPLLPGRMCHFREDDAATLAFIAAQVSPVLQTLDVRIEREMTVALIRHDLLTPMLMIRDTTESLQEALADRREIPEVKLQNIQDEIYRAMAMAEDLAYDKLTKGELSLCPTLLEGDIVARVKAMLLRMAEAKKMSIWFGDTFRNIPKLLVDPRLIERALVNLVVNAIKYGDANSTIRIEADDSRPNYYGVSVANWGIGVKDQDRARIFLPNYRADNAMRITGPGVGLGLAIARRALDLHEGKVELTALDKPTVFTLLIPKSRRVL